MAEIKTYQVGYCTHLACIALKGAGWRVCRFPARAYVIEVRKKLWLWDTGYASHFETYTAQGIFKIYPKITPIYFEPKEAIVWQLAEQGIQSVDLEGLILSHFHGDHIAGLRDFPQTALYCSGSGWMKTRGLRGFSALQQGFVPGLIPADFEARVNFVENFDLVPLPVELVPFEEGWMLPDSEGEVYLVALPGHAKGHLGAFIQTDLGWILLASDAAWSAQSYRNLREPSVLARLIMDDYKQFYTTLKKLYQLHQNGKVKIYLCHEGEL